jgi:signal transduction protein with GAF and PtsI domain
MIGRSSTAEALKERAVSGKDLAAQLAHDRQFRKQILAAVGHGAAARRRARRRIGLFAVAARLASDELLREELREMAEDLRGAWSRVERKQSHRLRATAIVLVGAGLAAWAAPQLKEFFSSEQNDDHGAAGADPA